MPRFQLSTDLIFFGLVHSGVMITLAHLFLVSCYAFRSNNFHTFRLKDEGSCCTLFVYSPSLLVSKIESAQAQTLVGKIGSRKFGLFTPSLQNSVQMVSVHTCHQPGGTAWARSCFGRPFSIPGRKEVPIRCWVCGI